MTLVMYPSKMRNKPNKIVSMWHKMHLKSKSSSTRQLFMHKLKWILDYLRNLDKLKVTIDGFQLGIFGPIKCWDIIEMHGCRCLLFFNGRRKNKLRTCWWWWWGALCCLFKDLILGFNKSFFLWRGWSIHWQLKILLQLDDPSSNSVEWSVKGHKWLTLPLAFLS